MQRPAGRELVRGREQHGPLPAQPVHPGAVLVERQRNGPYRGRRQQLAVEAQTVRLHGQRPPQHPAAVAEQQPQRVREAGADHDPRRLGPHATRACQVLGERLPQLAAAGRITRPERLVGCLLERPPVRGQPGGPRERRRVRRALPQVVPRSTRAWRRLPGYARGGAQRFGPFGDPRARALAGGQPALGDEFGVRVGDRVAGDAQVGGERTVRRQPGARAGAARRARRPATPGSARPAARPARTVRDAGRRRSAPPN